uniref:Kinase-like protein n=1 Tax=Rhizophora mucronata TaxID=61149 RepID=A0A2P2KTZ1_RHIMU
MKANQNRRGDLSVFHFP